MEEPLRAKSMISYVPDSPEIYDKLKGIEYLNFIADMYGISKIKERKDGILSRHVQYKRRRGDIIELFSWDETEVSPYVRSYE